MGPYIKEGMTVLDFGCGPGYFTIDMAQMVGKAGTVIAADLQEGMLRKLADKIRGTEVEGRITLHKTGEDSIGVCAKVDFVLAFYVVHEVPDHGGFFKELQSTLRQGGLILMVEPPLAVSKKAFESAVRIAEDAGFRLLQRPRVLFSKAAILQNGKGGRLIDLPPCN